MKVKMLITKKGSPDGIRVEEHKAEEVYDLPPELAKVYINQGWAVGEIKSEETKVIKPAETKENEDEEEVGEDDAVDYSDEDDEDDSELGDSTSVRANKRGRGKTFSSRGFRK